ncbi:MAG: C-terminal binding protein [Planctomycetota bacterium]
MAEVRSGRYKVAVQKGGRDGFELEREALDPIGAEIVEIPARSEEEFVEAARDAHALIARGRRITREIIRGLERCVVIGCGSIGTDHVDVDAATEAGIVVTNVPDVFIEEVADHAMALFLAAYRRLTEMDRLIREGRFREGHPSFRGTPRLWGQTFGLISFGNVAHAMARRLRPFGLQVISHDPYVSELERTAEGVEPVGFTELLERSDFVSNHLPLNATTRRRLTTEHFRAMKRTAIFINTGRGGTVDEEALIQALETGEIAGAALDVFEREPLDPESPLLRMENVVCTPHVASASSRMMPETRRRLGQELASALQGYWPRSAVNPAVLPRTPLRRWQPYPMTRGPNR